jgi:hypothetical protein
VFSVISFIVFPGSSVDKYIGIISSQRPGMSQYTNILSYFSGAAAQQQFRQQWGDISTT